MGMSDTIFGSYTLRERNKVKKQVDMVLSLENKMKLLSNEELKQKTIEFRNRLNNGETENDIMIEAFAVCKEASRRVLNMAHYPVQIESAIAMSSGTISEMKTGEGKTLVQTLNAYLNAISGKGVHVITSNDYLAKRDALLNKDLYEFLGLSCNYVQSNGLMKKSERRKAYKSDIVYTTASTVAFDYLGDNTVKDKEKRVLDYDKKGLNPLNYAVVDEVDSIMLDDGSIPLILSEKVEDAKSYVDKYEWAIDFASKLECTLSDKEEDSQGLTYTDAIIFKDNAKIMLGKRVDRLLLGEKDYSSLTIDEQIKHEKRKSLISDCLLALHYYEKDKDYQLCDKKGNQKQKEIVLVDKSTSRLATGRRLMNGLHEAIEAKERKYAKDNNLDYEVEIKTSAITKATCTYPDFFSQFKSGICGMTGTSNIKEFEEIYGLSTYEVPSRKPNIRVDEEEEIYLTQEQKYKAIIEEVLKARETLQPVLIGTTSVSESELISKMLKEYGIRHQTLNAVKNENEAGIIENAGLLGSVTVATNMAGRGTDIKLGKGVSEVGGLYVIGTTRNKNSRIDNQLKGRAARQGDPGKTKFFASFDDEFVKLNGGLQMKKAYSKLFDSAGKSKNGIITNTGKIKSKSVHKFIDACQENEEMLTKDARMQSEKFGKILTIEKNYVYEFREKLLLSDNINEFLEERLNKYIDNMFEYSNSDELKNQIGHIINLNNIDQLNGKEIKEYIKDELHKKISTLPKDEENMNKLKENMISIVDDYWQDQITFLNSSKTDAYNMAYAQKDPFIEYTNSAQNRFVDMQRYIHVEFMEKAFNIDMNKQLEPVINEVKR